LLKNQVIRASKVLDVMRKHQQQAAGRAISGISNEGSVDIDGSVMVKTSTKKQ